MNNRIKEIRLACGLSQDSFAKKLGLKSRGKIANLEFGKIELDKEFAKLICSTFDVNEKWLWTGEGEMFLPSEDDVAEYVSELLEDEDNPFYDIIKAIMKTYLELDEKNKAIFKSFAKSLTDNIKEEGRD